MSSRVSPLRRVRQPWCHAIAILAGVMMICAPVEAGHQGLRNSSVGGISINVEGVVGPPSDSARKMVLSELRKDVQPAAGELNTPVDLRMVSLRGLEAACEAALRDNFGRFPEEVKYVAGLQRIQYVFVYPESNDIVLAGPGEGWKVNDQANVVGVTTGRPVLQLDDLLVALRSVHEARQGGITVSIDPTEEGNRNLQAVWDQQRGNPVNPPVLEAAMKKAFGPQQVKIMGVQPTTHFARVLVAADYKMKRLAMKLEPAPVKGLPSYIDLIKNVGAMRGVTPRWWMACNYDPLAASDDGLAWELRGPGVKVMTEDQYFTPEGRIEETGRTSGPAQRWADKFTEKYDELSVADPVFGELRNLMDMCVVAALIEKEHLADKAGCSLPLLTGVSSDLSTEAWNAPKTISPEVSLLHTRNSWIVTASGGVQIESWQVASQSAVDPKVTETRTQATPNGKSLWWQ